MNFVVATEKPWNIAEFEDQVRSLPETWYLIDDPKELTVDHLRYLAPRYVFFPHWSQKVRQAITEEFECVAFHMTDLPYGRGGSPLQNLIQRGHTDTVISALQMTAEIDCGPIYMKRPLSLEGNAQEIYTRAAAVIFKMIREIAAENPRPIAQTKGEYERFERRSPEQSKLPSGSPHELYDHIRMLDADTYPRAFIKQGKMTFELTDARLDGDQLSFRAYLR